MSMKNKKIILIGLGSMIQKVFSVRPKYRKNLNPRGKSIRLSTAENAMTGIALGALLMAWFNHHSSKSGIFLIISEQIFNQVAKWYFMALEKNVPLVIRLIIGRGWGQGPQHSQSLESVFSIPGLKVVTLSTPKTKRLINFKYKDKIL